MLEETLKAEISFLQCLIFASIFVELNSDSVVLKQVLLETSNEYS